MSKSINFVDIAARSCSPPKRSSATTPAEGCTSTACAAGGGAFRSRGYIGAIAGKTSFGQARGDRRVFTRLDQSICRRCRADLRECASVRARWSRDDTGCSARPAAILAAAGCSSLRRPAAPAAARGRRSGARLRRQPHFARCRSPGSYPARLQALIGRSVVAAGVPGKPAPRACATSRGPR